jgi:uroporphyrin-III C-methyltransferase
MSEPTAPPESPPAELPALTLPPRRDARLPRLLWLVAGLALGGVAVLFWLTWQGSARVEATRAELARRLADSEAAQREAQANARQNREALDALQAKVGAMEARQAEMQSQQMAMDAMYQEISRVREDRLLAEIEQEVAIAAQQLQIAGNVEAALIALQGVEARLAKSAQPQFFPLRKLIARDIERLKSLPGADVPGIALKLETLLNAVAQLPLAFEQRPVPAQPELHPPAAVPPTVSSDWQSMLRGGLADLWREVRQLVRIERIDHPDPGLLAPRETYFLRENLRLRLLSARLALLARDGRSFQSDLLQAEAWLGHYFDTRVPAVAEARENLKNLARLDVVRDPVELNETLSALRNFKLVRDRSDRSTAR